MNVLTVPNGIVVALFGIVLSASFCDICWTKRNRIVLVAGTAVILLLQGAITFGASWDAMQELYPFTTHLPLAAVLGVLSGDWLWPTISVFAAYLCCQLRRWAALLVVALMPTPPTGCSLPLRCWSHCRFWPPCCAMSRRRPAALPIIRAPCSCSSAWCRWQATFLTM